MIFHKVSGLDSLGSLPNPGQSQLEVWGWGYTYHTLWVLKISEPGFLQGLHSNPNFQP